MILTFFLLASVAFAQQQARTPVDIPSEEAVGKVFLINVVTAMMLKPPEQIQIHPCLFVKGGKTHVIGDFCAVIEGKDIAEFTSRIGRPTEIGTAEVSCPNFIICWNHNWEPNIETKPSFKGLVLLDPDPDHDHVRLRMHTDNAIYPTVDYVYENTGLKKWIQSRGMFIKK